ncbi:MAG: cyclic nucleotide-binding domain-containing protein [Spirochaetes bacterium]|nr:cyclic nucleotide-binding domain-containing protein [Spirochaetota bacterium]
MAEKFIRLYTADSSPDCAYLLNNGKVFLYDSTMDKYIIKGQNLIIGSTELIMNKLLNYETLRIETAVASEDSIIKKIPTDKFLSALNTFSFLINTATVLAKQVMLTSKILNKNIEVLKGKDKQFRELAIKYYIGVFRLNQEYEKRKLPWLSDILKKNLNSLNYKKGEAFYRSQDSITIEASHHLSDKMVEYPRGSIICKENTEGEEMYILESGSIDVEIGGNIVATIEKKGSVIGEMALLLNEKRTATLKSKNNVVITIIKKKELKEICERQTDFMKSIAVSLAQKHYYNIININAINKSLIENHIDNITDDKTVTQIEKLQESLYKLKNELDDVIYKKRAEFLKPITDEL